MSNRHGGYCAERETLVLVSVAVGHLVLVQCRSRILGKHHVVVTSITLAETVRIETERAACTVATVQNAIHLCLSQ